MAIGGATRCKNTGPMMKQDGRGYQTRLLLSYEAKGACGGQVSKGRVPVVKAQEDEEPAEHPGPRRDKLANSISNSRRFKGFPLPGKRGRSGSGSSGRSSPAPVGTVSAKARAPAAKYPNIPLGGRRPSIGRGDRTPANGWGGSLGREIAPPQHPYLQSIQERRAKRSLSDFPFIHGELETCGWELIPADRT
ncbi:uncharacterized protein FPRO_03507 [Fusarium proliferatum ET1]|uniref:Uncharacterized protein n=1 Tax=Fusarium proliferatum (strain ET1) TaxID=1227346 RepID=A0A1L7V5W2_FUSPR|nr:uncharacterized protein FPRO_03507 [Fusarium proliferatum ET1]CZR36233.1 uncharacterized protein FPRO_03507 [Fusarium proliferatum ET1]